jgi:hypothetical protein
MKGTLPKITLLLFGFIVTEVLSALNCREDYCINCIPNMNYTHKCGLCRYSRTTLDGDCSGPIPIEFCESYHDSDSLCRHCKEDYYLTPDLKGCQAINITKCRFGYHDGTDGRVKCSACDKRYPSNDHFNCTDDEVPDNCMYGGHAKNGSVIEGSTLPKNESGMRFCWACKKGWSRSANSTQCVSPCAHGCYYCNLDNICTECDKYNGYYEVWRSRDYGYPKCEHFSQLLSSLIFPALILFSFLAGIFE